MPSHVTQDNQGAARWSSIALVVGLAVAASATGLSNGFAYDDLPIIVENARIHDWRQLWRLFGDTYWSGPFAPDLYRPGTLVFFGIQWTLSGGDPLLFHVGSLVLYALLSAAVLALFRVFLTPGPAVIGAALWAVHPVHVEAVANVVGQAELLAALAVVTAAVLYARGRLQGGLTPRKVVGIVGVFAVGLSAKEHAIVLPVLIGLIEVLCWRLGQRWRAEEGGRGWLLCRMLFLTTGVYLVVRGLVVGGVTGVPHDAFIGMSTRDRLWGAISLWPEVARLLLWPIRLYADYSPQHVVLQTGPHRMHLVAGILAGGGALLAAWAWRAQRMGLLVGLLWIPLTYALVSNLPFPTGILIAERTLLLPSVGVAMAAGGIFQMLWRPVARTRALVITLVSVVVSAGVWRSASRQPAWTDSLTVFTTLVADAPLNYRGHGAVGEMFLRLGNPERAEDHLKRSVALMPQATGPRLHYARLLQMTQRCAEALPVIEHGPTRHVSSEEGVIIRSACLLSLRRCTEARRTAVVARAGGFAPQVLSRVILAADSLLAATDSIDVRNSWVGSGRPFERTARDFNIVVFQYNYESNRLGMNGGRRPELRLGVPVRTIR
jgi:hypothetical protein